ncbi:hypothetical protein DL93DRAFT_2074970 [Clavulina sp. PMI_390]|nr:hypothetical protein DL93DRAFT_2074970 [Clavulina sp. PMI_390]
MGVGTDAPGEAPLPPSLALPGGTVAFRALDLCNDDRLYHLYRHDLESFFYVLVWIVANHSKPPAVGPTSSDTMERPNGNNFKDTSGQPAITTPATDISSTVSPLSKWHIGTWDEIYSHKAAFLRKDTYGAFPAQGPLSSMTLPALQAMFREGYEAEQERFRGTEPFDEETLGGNVTFQRFVDILEGSM